MTNDKSIPARTIQGPKAPFAIALRILFKPGYTLLSCCQELRDRFGDVVRIRIPFFPLTYQITDPDLIGRILMGTEKSNRKASFFDRLKILLGDGLLTAGGDLWKTNRRLANPAFHPRMLDALCQVIEDEALKMADDWDLKIKDDPIVDLSEEMTKLTFTIIAKALFTIDVSERVQGIREAINSVQEMANVLFFMPVPLPLWVPTPFNRRLRKALRLLDGLAYDLIAEHRAQPDRYKDLLSAYLSARDEDTGEGMSDKQLRDEILTLIVAGHETTATTLAMGFEALSRESRVLEKIDQELTAFQTGDGAQAYKKLNYVAMVTQEIMRLYPAIWSVGREMDEDLTCKGYTIPKGATVLLVQYLAHRHPDYWQDPDRFLPERFSPEQSGSRHPFAYFPFGGGARNCVGMALAKLEVQVVLSIFLRRFRFSTLPDENPYAPIPRITMVPEPNIRLRVQKR